MKDYSNARSTCRAEAHDAIPLAIAMGDGGKATRDPVAGQFALGLQLKDSHSPFFRGDSGSRDVTSRPNPAAMHIKGGLRFVRLDQHRLAHELYTYDKVILPSEA
jgi:hypothetical protein